MKRLFVIMIALLFAVTAFSQSNLVQEKNVWRGGWVKDPYFLFERGETVSTTATYFEDFKAADTSYSDEYYLYPYNYGYATVADTNAAADSVYIIAELWVSQRNDTTAFCYEKTLAWDNQSGSIQNQAYISGTGYWKCDFCDSEITGLYYYFIKFYTSTGHRVKNNGVKFQVEMVGHILP